MMVAMQKGWRKKEAGFTIVELLIVIVVIAVLAAITVVAFNGIQDRSHDTRMKNGVAQLERAIRMLATTTGELPRGGWSSTVAVNASTGQCADGSGGWVTSGTYACAIEDMLLAKQLIPSGFLRGLPINTDYGSPTDGARSLMFYPCSGGRYALYWHLRNPASEDAASLTYVESQGCTSAPRTTYGMSAAKLIDLNS